MSFLLGALKSFAAPLISALAPQVMTFAKNTIGNMMPEIVNTMGQVGHKLVNTMANKASGKGLISSNTIDMIRKMLAQQAGKVEEQQATNQEERMEEEQVPEGVMKANYTPISVLSNLDKRYYQTKNEPSYNMPLTDKLEQGDVFEDGRLNRIRERRRRNYEYTEEEPVRKRRNYEI